MTTSDIKKRFLSSRGSVLMEFVMVLPVYIAVMGGTLWMGLKSLDATMLRTVDHWAVWSGGNRFQTRYPAMAALWGLFPRSTALITNLKRALQAEHGYLQFIGSKTTLFQQPPEYISNWMNMPFTVTGESKPWWMNIPEISMSSSRFGNDYTQFIVMRAKHSKTSRRHWHPSLVADQDIWKFEGKEDEYPKKWEEKVLSNAKYTSDEKNERKEPKKIDFYERFDPYVEWSTPAE